jgi:hypothetical protein
MCSLLVVLGLARSVPQVCGNAHIGTNRSHETWCICYFRPYVSPIVIVICICVFSEEFRDIDSPTRKDKQASLSGFTQTKKKNKISFISPKEATHLFQSWKHKHKHHNVSSAHVNTDKSKAHDNKAGAAHGHLSAHTELSVSSNENEDDNSSCANPLEELSISKQGISDSAYALTMESVSLEHTLDEMYHALKLAMIPQCCVLPVRTETNAHAQAHERTHIDAQTESQVDAQQADTAEGDGNDSSTVLELVDTMNKALNTSPNSVKPSSDNIVVNKQSAAPAPVTTSYMEKMFCSVMEVRSIHHTYLHVYMYVCACCLISRCVIMLADEEYGKLCFSVRTRLAWGRGAARNDDHTARDQQQGQVLCQDRTNPH